MKKMFSLILAVMMIATMSVTAFAAESELTGSDKSESVNVTAKYASGITEAGTVYNVDVTWDSMEFTYTVGGVNTWNPETHQYEVVGAGGAWNHTTSKVTVTNHSNVAVTAKFSFAPVEGGTVTGSFDKSSVELPSAVGKAVNAAELTGTSTFTIGGTVASTQTEVATVGTITITIE